MKKMYFLLVILCISLQSLYSVEFDKSKLPNPGVSRISTNKQFQAYSNGYSSMEIFSISASLAVKKLELIDTLPPEPELKMDCMGNVNKDKARYVIDKPRKIGEISGLAHIHILEDISYNYKLFYSDFKPCEDDSASWGLEILDPTQDAFAYVSFWDCRGNIHDTGITYIAPDVKLIDEKWDLGKQTIGQENWHQFHLVNYGTTSWKCTRLYLKNGAEEGYVIFSENKTSKISLPILIKPGDSLDFWVRFSSNKRGTFQDSLGFGNDCFFYFKTFLKVEVVLPIIDVSDIIFPKTDIDSRYALHFVIKNSGLNDLEISGFEGPSITGLNSGTKIFSLSHGSGYFNISKKNPLILKPGKDRSMYMEFYPDDSISYFDEMKFISNSIKTHPNGIDLIDSICVLSGKGAIKVGISEQIINKIQLYPNPTEDILIIDKLPMNTCKIQIFDETGKEVRSIDIKNQSESLKISTKDLPVGAYILRLFVGGEVVDKKFVVIR